jgi:hypothetical protein
MHGWGCDVTDTKHHGSPASRVEVRHVSLLTDEEFRMRRSRHLARAATTVMTALLLVIVGSGAAIADPTAPPAPPSGLRATGIEWNRVELAWEPSATEDLWRYEIIDLDRNQIVGIGSAVTATGHVEVQPERTYRFAVQAAKPPVNGEQIRSGRSNVITVSTPEQFLPSPAGLTAERAGNSVTLRWERSVDPAIPVQYVVHQGGEPEAIITSDGQAVLEQTIPRVAAGTQEFTVVTRHTHPHTYGPGISAPSTVTVEIAGTSDTTPPDSPEAITWIHNCRTDQGRYEIDTVADDVTAPDDIQYDQLTYDTRTRERYVSVSLYTPAPSNGYDIPRVHAGPAPRMVRTVDEAGNRSDRVEPAERHMYEEEEFC